MSILTLGSKKRREGKFPIKEKRRKISNQRESKRKREGKFPIKGKKGSKGIPNQRMGERKKKEEKEESSWSKKPEEMCRKVFGPYNI